jgi:hypothetical protein
MHERCNHRNMETISQWIRRGLLPVDPSVAACPDPICTACQFGKVHRKSHASNKGSIAAACSQPGDSVSADQLEAGYPGKIPFTKGLPTMKRYKYCNLLVDNYSRYIYPTFHETKHATELIQSKKEFQSFTAHHGVTIHKIRADNGVYSVSPFQLLCEQDNQELSFYAVGSHWQNGIAERHIGIVTETAWTLLLHACSQWPDVFTEEFRPFAIRHACTLHNASFRHDTKQSPHQMFTGVPSPWCIRDFRVFGCPVFVLNKRLQDGNSLPKWKARSWTGVYVGHSLQHAGNVLLIYNPATTHVSPQYHVVFDDQFKTVCGSAVSRDNLLQKLYDKALWSYKLPSVEATDLYLFESFWSDPPPLKKTSIREKPHHHNSLRHPKPCSPTMNQSQNHTVHPAPHPGNLRIHPSEQAPYPAGDHAAPPSEHAVSPASDHAALPSEHAATPPSNHAGDHATKPSKHAVRSDSDDATPPSERAGHPASDHVVLPGGHAQNLASNHASHESVPIRNLASDQAENLGEHATSHDVVHTGDFSAQATQTPYINLTPVACSAALLDYQHANGIQATVYTAHSTSSQSTLPGP